MELSEPPVNVVNRDLIKDILFIDWQQRNAISRGQRVDLHPVSMINNVRNLYTIRGQNDSWHLVTSPDVLNIEPNRYCKIMTNRLYTDPLKRLNDFYSDLALILSLFPGEVYCAGGVLFRAIWGKPLDSDCDLFFVNCSKERIDQILRQVYLILSEKHGQKKVIGIRNQNTTTFCIWKSDDYDENPDQEADHLDLGIKYQFVHGRSYPSKEAIVIGFDLGTSALLYDGHEITGTTLGIFCTALCMNILDPSRRSTSYEARILKYSALKVGLFATCADKDELREYYGTQFSPCLKKHELAKGIFIGITGERLSLIPYNSNGALKKTDYGQVETSMYWLCISNARLACAGKYDQMMWTGHTASEIFTNPKIKIYLGAAFEDYEVDNTMYGERRRRRPRRCKQKTLATWIGSEKVDQIVKKYPRYPPKYLPFDDYCQFIPDLKEEIEAGRLIAEEMAAKGVSYIGPDENPGRQYTSSFNPVYSDVREYYGAKGIVTKIGIPDEVYFVLKCALKEAIGGYWKTPCALIMEQIVRLTERGLIAHWTRPIVKEAKPFSPAKKKVIRKRVNSRK